MKHLKTWRVFESTDEDSHVQYIEDIFLDLRDEGFKVSVVKQGKVSRLFKLSSMILTSGPVPDILTLIEGRRSVSFETYSPTLHHLCSYMKDSGYKICDFEINYYDGKFPGISHIFENGKPLSVEVKTDPVGYCDREFIGKTIKRVRITFVKS
jgi:hypothetical protein